LVKNCKLDRPPSFKEVQLRRVEINLDKFMDALAPRGNNVPEVQMSINPNLNKLLFVEVKPRLNDIANLSSMVRYIAVLKSLESLLEGRVIF
jgi:hypothetical protein